tara:strand:+ start:3253 stop:3426 length:174 start_codon:yes stop_codon:yes gene_type:complete
MRESEKAKLEMLKAKLLRMEQLLVLSGRHRKEHPMYNNYDGLEEMADDLLDDLKDDS